MGEEISESCDTSYINGYISYRKLRYISTINKAKSFIISDSNTTEQQSTITVRAFGSGEFREEKDRMHSFP